VSAVQFRPRAPFFKPKSFRSGQAHVHDRDEIVGIDEAATSLGVDSWDSGEFGAAQGRIASTIYLFRERGSTHGQARRFDYGPALQIVMRTAPNDLSGFTGNQNVSKVFIK
jgi:hypothetical protein